MRKKMLLRPQDHQTFSGYIKKKFKILSRADFFLVKIRVQDVVVLFIVTCNLPHIFMSCCHTMMSLKIQACFTSNMFWTILT